MSEKFIVFSKNCPLVEFSSGKNSKYKIEDLNFYNEFKYLFLFEMRGNETADFLESWLAKRITVIGRKTLATIEEAKQLDKNDSLRFVKLTHALSLNDVFWLRTAESNLTWKDVNLYSNNFSDELAQLALSNFPKRSIVFASSSPQYTLKGAMAKCWIRRNNILLLCKIDSKPKKFLQSQACMEWIASEVAHVFGIPHIKYWREHINTSVGLGSFCEAFTSEDIGFVEAFNFYRYCGISEEALRSEELFRESSFQHRLSEYFSDKQIHDMMIFDYLIGNTDRHLLNSGMLYDTNTGEILGPAPIYDNGLSFFSWDEMPNSVSEVEDWIKENDLTTTFSDAGQLEEFLLPEHEEKIRKVSNLSLKPKFEI